MQTYKHYSFDLWLTLIRSNPRFKIERTRIFHERFNPANKSIEEIGLIFRQVDIMCNNINERTGKNLDADEMYLMVISMISDFSVDLLNVNADDIYSEMEDLLFKHIPIVYDDVTIPTLESLTGSSCTISILSNTGFIKGRTLRKVLKTLGLDPFFDFQLYSDEEGMSKPNPDFFNLMLKQIESLKRDCGLEDIIHIGDNPRADVSGAKAVGIEGLLVNSNNMSITTLLCKEHQPILSIK